MSAQAAFAILIILAPYARGELSSSFTENTTWISSDILDTLQPVGDYKECQQLCADHHNCSVFTWTSEENQHTKLFCFLFGETYNKTSCEHCVSGPNSCTCSTESACSAQEDNVDDVISHVMEEAECQSLCSSHSSCSVYTWYDGTGFPSYTCLLLTSCAERDQNCSGCFTGPPHCSAEIPETLTPGILVAGGNGEVSKYTDIYLPLQNRSCRLADDRPEDQTYGTMNTVEGVPVFCYDHSCQQFSITGDSGAWTHYANTSMERYDHSSWVSRAGLSLLGGYFSGSTTELVPGGPNFTLADPTERACSIQSADSSYVIITGGYYTGDVVARYDITGLVERLPSLTERRESHACGTYHDGDNNIQVVAGGWDRYSYTYLSSTEWLIAGVSDHWTRGNPLPRAMAHMAFSTTATQMFILGGIGGGDERDEVYSLTGGSQEGWRLVGRLPGARFGGAAATITVDSDICG